ncbi:tyrosine-type recombinase/integrase [Bdellovibrio sp. ArHS]|uniref:tyrosine-type recombinase/integrase n=1 Tax=Bdellovibrio sp. ArHS TaxID=1569284 RepID=UPI0025C444F7|nr:tyrosine-type recombinase/integrase [Bdellovibrio sp. ArHS]
MNCSWSSKNGIKSTKSGADRLIDIAPSLLALLRELKAQAEDQHWVLPRNDRWDRGQQAKDLRMFLQVVGLPQIRFHDLRATWATLLLAQGVQPFKVMAMGGRNDMETMILYKEGGIEHQRCYEGF